jgi:hypothetical protein
MHGCHPGRYLRWKQLPNATSETPVLHFQYKESAIYARADKLGCVAVHLYDVAHSLPSLGGVSRKPLASSCPEVGGSVCRGSRTGGYEGEGGNVLDSYGLAKI